MAFYDCALRDGCCGDFLVIGCIMDGAEKTKPQVYNITSTPMTGDAGPNEPMLMTSPRAPERYHDQSC